MMIMSSTVRERVIDAAVRLVAAGTEITRTSLRAEGCRYSDELLGLLIRELLDDGVIRPEHLNRYHPARRGTLPGGRCNRGGIRAAAEERRVELPPLRQHAPETPTPAAVAAEEPLWDWLAKRYWTPTRRRLYRRAMA